MNEKKQLTVAQWFGRGDEFWASARILEKADSQLASPNVVLRAFATEAYLKCLLTLRKKHFPPDHDLKRLFDLLPLDDKNLIEEEWNKYTFPNLSKAASTAPTGITVANSLRQALKLSSSAFKDFRYRASGNKYWYLGSFPMQVRHRVFTIHPDWENSPPDIFGKHPHAYFRNA